MRWLFEDLINAAMSDTTAEPDRASADLRRALGLWRGAPYADVPDAAFAQTEIRRLEALRERALEAAIDSDLQRGMDAELIPELEALVAENPFRERLWTALIVALYRAGRQARGAGRLPAGPNHARRGAGHRPRARAPGR